MLLVHTDDEFSHSDYRIELHNSLDLEIAVAVDKGHVDDST